LVEEVYGTLDLPRALRDALARPGYDEAFRRARTHPDRQERDAMEWVLFEAAVRAMKSERDEAPTSRLRHRDPLPVQTTTTVLRLRVVGGYSWREIETATRLSRRKVGYIAAALKHGDLGWDLHQNCTVLGPDTRNTPAGLIVPKR
jgi:hypothetical protein